MDRRPDTCVVPSTCRVDCGINGRSRNRFASKPILMASVRRSGLPFRPRVICHLCVESDTYDIMGHKFRGVGLNRYRLKLCHRDANAVQH